MAEKDGMSTGTNLRDQAFCFCFRRGRTSTVVAAPPADLSSDVVVVEPTTRALDDDVDTFLPAFNDDQSLWPVALARDGALAAVVPPRR